MRTENFGHAILNVTTQNDESVTRVPKMGSLCYMGESKGGQPVFDFEEAVRAATEVERKWKPRKTNRELHMRITKNEETGQWRIQFRIDPKQLEVMSGQTYQVYEEAMSEAVAFVDATYTTELKAKKKQREKKIRRK